MRIGASLLLIAVGAILKYAITKHVSGIDIQTIGVILMIIGIVGLVLSLILWGTRRRTTVVQSGAAYGGMPVAGTPVVGTPVAGTPVVGAPGQYVAPPVERRTTYVTPNDPADLM
jgi:hypothetical protein